MTNITSAHATGVLKFPVGGRKPGTSPRRFEKRMKIKLVPRRGRYFLAFSRDPIMFANKSKRKSMIRISKMFLKESFSSGRADSPLERLFFILYPANVKRRTTKI